MTAKGTLALFPVADFHMGMLAWKRECGSSWDLDIAAKELREAFAKLVERMPPAESAVLLGMGDAMHADNTTSMTPKSHNILDVDGRWQKALQYTEDYFKFCVDYLLPKYKHVLVRVLKGNHDPHSSISIASSLASHYRTNKRVEVSTDPNPFWYYKHGTTMLMATHGSEVRAEKVPGIMAARQPKMFGETVYRYAFLGHVHHSGRLLSEGGGVIVETLGVPIPRDAYAHEKGFCANRTMIAVEYSLTHGEMFRVTVNLDGCQE